MHGLELPSRVFCLSFFTCVKMFLVGIGSPFFSLLLKEPHILKRLTEAETADENKRSQTEREIFDVLFDGRTTALLPLYCSSKVKSLLKITPEFLLTDFTLECTPSPR